MRALAAAGAALLVLGLAAPGCGQGDEVEAEDNRAPRAQTDTPDLAGNPAAGKIVWAQAGCGSCHTMRDAGSTGTIGPNLDETQPDVDVVMDRVENGKGRMPAFKDRLSEKEISDVAAYVLDATQLSTATTED